MPTSRPTPPAEPAPAPWGALRVAFVTETYPPEVNGVATTTAQFVARLRLRRHEVQVVRPAQAVDATRPTDDLLMRGVPIPGYPHLRMGLPSKGRLMQYWRRQRPDVVHVATEGPLGWSAFRAAAELGLPVTSDFRTNFQAYSRHYRIGWLQRPIEAYLRNLHNRAACTLVPTEPLRRELAAAGFERVAVVPRGVDTRRFDPEGRQQALRTQWGADRGELVIGHVGRLAAEKNLGLVITAWRAVRAFRPNARLVFVGDGPMRTELQQTCPGAVFTGLQRDDALAEHFASLDLFLFPSITETFGNVTLEALASGLPVVAFDHAAAGQVIDHGRDGLLAPLGDAGAFVREAAALARDPVRRAALGAAARARALTLGWDAVLTRFEAHLAAACFDELEDPLLPLPPARHHLA